jgi:hypothetical protein
MDRRGFAHTAEPMQPNTEAFVEQDARRIESFADEMAFFPAGVFIRNSRNHGEKCWSE